MVLKSYWYKNSLGSEVYSLGGRLGNLNGRSCTDIINRKIYVIRAGQREPSNKDEFIKFLKGELYFVKAFIQFFLSLKFIIL